MMLPLPCAFMTGAACFMPRKTPRRSTAIVRSYSSIGVDSIGPTAPPKPALLNMQSRRPNSWSARSTAPFTSASSATSVCWYTAAPPSVSASVSPFASCTSAITTRAPSATNRRTVPSPMPLAPPVMIATLSSSRPMRSPSLTHCALPSAATLPHIVAHRRLVRFPLQSGTISGDFDATEIARSKTPWTSTAR